MSSKKSKNQYERDIMEILASKIVGCEEKYTILLHSESRNRLANLEFKELLIKSKHVQWWQELVIIAANIIYMWL